MLEHVIELVTGFAVIPVIVGGIICTGLVVQWSTNLSRNMSLANDNATKGLKD